MDSESVQLRHFVKTSDAEAFSEIVHRHAGLVYGACLRVLSDRDKAADATQETFLELLRNAENITGSLSSWLHRVATRRAINMAVKDSSRRRREAKYAAEKPLNSSRWEDISTYIDEGLDDLDEEMREILIGHFFEGRTMVEIAADKGISQPTVSRRIESGIGALREKLRKRGIVVAAAAFSSLLVQNAVEAAPSLVLKELGKISIAGANAAAASGIGGAASVSGAGAKATALGVLAGIKAKIVTVAAVAVIGVGGVVTYQQVSNRPERGASGEQVSDSIEQSGSGEAPAAITSRREEHGQISRTATVVKPEASLVDTGDFEQDERPEDARTVISVPGPDVVDDDEREDAPVHEVGTAVSVVTSYARPRSEPNGEDEGTIPDAKGPPGGN
jgi:RNA polymerase sigma factor (sigma-70 family)